MRRVDVTGISITERATQSFRIYLRELLQYPPLSIHEEVALFEQMKSNDTTLKEKQKAKEKLIKHNLRFVISVAKKYYKNSLQEKCYDLSDLVCAGNIALVEAVDRFDTTRGFKFISYAVKCIQGEILNFLNSNDFVRIPLNRFEDIRKVNDYIQQQDEQENRQISFMEAVLEMDFSDRKSEVWKAHYFLQRETIIRADHPIADIENSYDNAYTLSEDEVLENRHIDFIADTGEKSQPDYLLGRQSDLTNIYRALAYLTYRELEVIALTFGLTGERNEAGECLTLEEIAGRFMLTRERCRAIKENAIRRLRRPTLSSVMLHGGQPKMKPPTKKLNGLMDFAESNKNPEYISPIEKFGFDRLNGITFIGKRLINKQEEIRFYTIYHAFDLKIESKKILSVCISTDKGYFEIPTEECSKLMTILPNGEIAKDILIYDKI